MITSDTPDLGQYLARIVGVDMADGHRHLARATVLEQATILDYALNEVLAVRLAANAQAASVLAFDVFSRIGQGDRVKMLKSLMEDHQMLERWPFVLPVLRRVFELRNRVAHGFMERLPDGRIRATSFNRGRESQTVYTPTELGWLVWQAQVVRNELNQVWTSLLPETDDWFEVGETFPDRIS